MTSSVRVTKSQDTTHLFICFFLFPGHMCFTIKKTASFHNLNSLIWSKQNYHFESFIRHDLKLIKWQLAVEYFLLLFIRNCSRSHVTPKPEVSHCCHVDPIFVIVETFDSIELRTFKQFHCIVVADQYLHFRHQ